MNSKISFVLGMVIGALAGVGASILYLKPKYETQKEKEVRSVIDEFNLEKKKIAERNEQEKAEIEMRDRERAQAAKDSINKIVSSLGYSESDYRMPSDVPISRPEELAPDADILPPNPYLIDQKHDGDLYEIPEEEYGDEGRFEIELTYYSDGILTDDEDKPIEDPVSLLGENIIEALDDKLGIGLEEIYVRDDLRERDYRISLMDISSDS